MDNLFEDLLEHRFSSFIRDDLMACDRCSTGLDFAIFVCMLGRFAMGNVFLCYDDV
jgi:hypothetical protein